MSFLYRFHGKRLIGEQGIFHRWAKCQTCESVDLTTKLLLFKGILLPMAAYATVCYYPK